MTLLPTQQKKRIEIGPTRAPHGDESYNFLIKVVLSLFASIITQYTLQLVHFKQ